MKVSNVDFKDAPKYRSSHTVSKNGRKFNSSVNLSFKNLIKAMHYERKMSKELGVKSSFGVNSFVAESVWKTAKIFEQLFGQKSLPNSVDFTSFLKKFSYGKSTLGLHINHSIYPEDEVYFNSDCKHFKNKNRLKFNELTEKMLWWQPTGHYLQAFVHEFAHSAHFKHLCSGNNGSVMSKLNDTIIPTVWGRFIAKFNLGRYSATNMNEFMAERITKDICKNLNNECKYIGYRSDVDYENIFQKRWKYRYTSPQSYLDYYTQQVWNGDIDGADKVTNDMIEYLKKIETPLEVHPTVEAIAEKTKESFLEKLARGLKILNKSFTFELDRRNDLRIGEPEKQWRQM